MNNAINHRNMRILLILILSIFSFMFCFEPQTSAFAVQTYTPKVTIQSKTVHRGQTFSVDVDLSDNEGLIDLFLTLDYDDTVMTLKNIIKGDALSSLKLTKQGNGQTIDEENEYDFSVKPMNLLWDGKQADTTNGKILTLIFDSSIEAPIGDYVVSMTYDKQNTNSAYMTPIDIEITNGIITFITGEFQAIYRDYDGSILYEKDYNADDIPAYPTTLPLPSREDDEKYSYEYVGWKGVVSDDINVLIFEANYKLTPQIYTVFYYIDGVNGEPDGIIDNNDYFDAQEVSYDSFIEILEAPFKQYYLFNGWYTDSGYTSILNFVKMPSHDVRLYGYYGYEVRETNIPLITLNTKELTSQKVVIGANVVRNTGLNGLVLTLEYDLTVMRFTGFAQSMIFSTMVFDTTNIEKMNEPDFKFIFEQAENSYETGEFLILYFDVIDSEKQGVYDVTFTYDYHHDATYRDKNNELKYTKLEIVGTEIPIGEIFHWNEDIGGGRVIDVTSSDGKPINVKLSVEFVTEKIYIEQEKIEQVVGKKMYLQSAYSIKLMQNNVEIEPNTTLTIKIKLSYQEQRCKILKFYYYTNDLELEEYEFVVEDGYLVFKTNHLSNWLIFGDYNKNKGFESDSKVVTLIMYPILLAITTMTYAFIQKGKFTKLKNGKNLNKEAHNE